MKSKNSSSQHGVEQIISLYSDEGNQVDERIWLVNQLGQSELLIDGMMEITRLNIT